MSGGMNQDVETEVNMEEAVVKGFKEGIVLLPHQVLGRSWMRDREDTTKKRTGGILADDMGFVPLPYATCLPPDVGYFEVWVRLYKH
jgi:hypothetical protein